MYIYIIIFFVQTKGPGKADFQMEKNRGKFHGFAQTPKIAGRYKGDPRKAGDGVVEEGCAEAIPGDFF